MRTEVQAGTAEELFRMPDDGFRHELVKGELRTRTLAGSKHGSLVIRLVSLLLQHDSCRRTHRKFWQGAPDLAIEVISPTDTLYEMIEEYLASGVTLVWVVNPKKRTVTAYRPGASPEILGERDQLDGRPILPLFQYPVAKLFEVKRR